MKKEYLNEIWKPIKGYEGLYEVSNLGRVKSLVNNKGQYREKILTPIIGKGYYRVRLFKNKQNKLYSVHRLVAEAFLDNPNNLPCINHKDENKLNNIVTNLEYCTYSYNSNYGTSIQRRIEKQSKKVYQYTLDGEFVREWKSTMECGRNGYSQQAISSCCRKELYRHTHKGFRWSYKKEGE